MQFTLTTESFINAVTNIVHASTEASCGLEVATTAQLVRYAVLGGQPSEELHQIIDAGSEVSGDAVSMVMGRAVSAHVTQDETMCLWLYPVIITANAALPSRIDLASADLTKPRITALLNRALGAFSGAGEGPASEGWTYVGDALHHAHTLDSMDIGQLIKYPLGVADYVKGARSKVTPLEHEINILKPGANIYFLPVVTKLAPGVAIVEPEENEQISDLIAQWVQTILDQGGLENLTSVTALNRPYLFSEAVDLYPRLELEVGFRFVLRNMLATRKIAPAALSALVASYTVANRNGEVHFGVSFLSNLTGQLDSTMALPSLPGKVEEALSILESSLKAVGISRVEVVKEPVRTFACQSCSALQFKVPQAQEAMACSGTKH